LKPRVATLRIVEALPDTGAEIAAVRLGVAEQTETHRYSPVQASQRAPGWLISFCAEKILGISTLLKRRKVWKGPLQI
jgi:hypothetical protein